MTSSGALTHSSPVAPELFDGIADPLFILATPRGFSSVISAMLGQHPDMYGLPETHLLSDERLEQWWARASAESFEMAHGLLRAVGQVCFGEQTEETVALARAWIKRRSTHTSGLLLEELARRVSPAVVIEKSPSLVYDVNSMQRALEYFPRARFLHLVRHPRGYCQSVITYLETLALPEYQPRERPTEPGRPPEWIRYLAHFPYPDTGAEIPVPALDPQGGWYVLNANVLEFLTRVPAEQQMTVRGEDILRDPTYELAAVARWLQLRADEAALEEMCHPERSPYAGFGPRGARLGNDILFLERPALRPARAESHSLEGPLEWRRSGDGFLPEVVELARSFGYR